MPIKEVLRGFLDSLRFRRTNAEPPSNASAQEVPQTPLKLLLEVNNALSQAPTLEVLCREAVELGRSRLGFDRLAIFLIDDDPRYARGMWGTDEQGQLRDERAVNRLIDSMPLIREALTSEHALIVQEDAPLYNHLGEVIAPSGWNVIAGLWNGQQCIGWLAADNLLRRQPLSPDQLEVLNLYSATLGHLCTLKRVEEALRRSEWRFRSIFEGASIGIAVVDRTGELMSFNPACQRMFGYSSEELRNLTFSDLIHPASRQHYVQIFSDLIQGQAASRQIEERCLHKDGSTIWANINLSVFPNPTRRQRHYVTAFIEDITERRRMEEQAQELIFERERVNLLSEFVRTISHDFRTPLAIVNTSLYLLERSEKEEDRQLRASQIARQVVHMTALVEGLLSMVRWDSGVPLDLAAVDLNSVVRDLETELRPLAGAKSQMFTLELDEDLPPLTADEVALKEALYKVIDNAIQYTPAAGTVSVRTCRRDGQALVEVEDTGIGIDPNDLPHIFNRLYRADKARSTETGGIGLGLPIAQKIIEAHGGRIEVESTPRVGSIFRVWLPLPHD